MDASQDSISTTADRAPPARRRPWLSVLVVVVAAYLAIVGLMMAFEDRLIFLASVYPEGYWQPAGLAFDDAWFTASDGTKLHGWYLARENPRAVALFAHGNAGNVSHRAELLEMLADLNVSVLIFDYRGYGRSEGSPSEAGVLDDARAARAWLAQRAVTDPSQVVLVGESLGGGVMVDLAAADGARGLVLLGAFSSLTDVAAFHYPWLPVRLLMRTRLDSLAKIGKYRGPLLQVHGDADTIIPIKLAQRLFAAANEPKRLVLVDGADHNDPPSPALRQALDQFLNELESSAAAN